MTNNSNTKKSVLIIGATGALGLQLLRHLAEESNVEDVHVMARDPTKLASADLALTASVQKGDAREVEDIEQALHNTEANYVILSTGNGLDTSKSDTRESTGRALANALLKPEFSHVQCIVMSSHGAAETKIIVGLGIGKLVEYHLRHVLKDHTKQESQFDANPSLQKRTLIVRPTSLTDNKPAKSLDSVVEFDGAKKSPTINVDRSDIAAWVAREIATKPTIAGRKVCLTNAK